MIQLNPFLSWKKQNPWGSLHHLPLVKQKRYGRAQRRSHRSHPHPSCSDIWRYAPCKGTGLVAIKGTVVNICVGVDWGLVLLSSAFASRRRNLIGDRWKRFPPKCTQFGVPTIILPLHQRDRGYHDPESSTEHRPWKSIVNLSILSSGRLPLVFSLDWFHYFRTVFVKLPWKSCSRHEFGL